MKSIFDKKLSSKLSEKVSSKLTLKGICKKFETVNYEQDNSAVYGWNTFQRELKQFLKRKEQELLGEIERFTKLYMESHRDNQDLEQEIYNLKQQLKQIKEGSLIPEIYIDDLNELSRLRKKIDEEWINKIKKHGLYCSKKGDIGIDLDDMIKQEESIRGDERNKIRKKIEDRIKELEKEKKIVEEIINNQKCYDCKLLQDTLGEECCNKHKDRLLEISCKIKELKSLLEVDK